MRLPAIVFLVALSGGFALPGAARADGTAQEHYDKAAELVQAKKFADAQKELEKAVAIDPKHVESQKVLAALLKRDGKLEAAAKHLEAVLEVEPDDVKVRAELGNTYATAAEKAAQDQILATSTEKRDKLAGKAIEAYRKVLEKEPDFAPVIFNLGTMQSLTERWADAVTTFDAYVEKKPDDARGRFYDAQACDKANADLAKTIAAWEAYLPLGKADAKQKKDVAHAEARLKDLKKKQRAAK